MSDYDIIVQDIATYLRRGPATIEEIMEEFGYPEKDIRDAIRLDHGNRVKLRGTKVYRMASDDLRWKTADALKTARKEWEEYKQHRRLEGFWLEVHDYIKGIR
jgi:hypothetical protein